MATKPKTPEEIEEERQYQLAEKERKEVAAGSKPVVENYTPSVEGNKPEEIKEAELYKPKGKVEAGATDSNQEPPSIYQNLSESEQRKTYDARVKDKEKAEKEQKEAMEKASRSPKAGG